MSKIAGKSRVYITNTMRLLKLDPYIQDAIVSKHISSGHGRAILALDSEKKRRMAYESSSIRPSTNASATMNLMYPLNSMEYSLDASDCCRASHYPVYDGSPSFFRFSCSASISVTLF